MRTRKIPWRFLLPGLIFPMSIVSWVQYYLSVRASDDSPAPWYWFGSPLSAWLNFPAYVYSAPAQPLDRFGIRLGRLWVHPRILMFFLLVIVFWYWAGIRVESWRAARTKDSVDEKPSRAFVLYALGAVLWIFVAFGTAWDFASAVHLYSLRSLGRHGDWDLLQITHFLWSAILAAYYARRCVLVLRGAKRRYLLTRVT
jgi:hypothetical protein